MKKQVISLIALLGVLLSTTVCITTKSSSDIDCVENLEYFCEEGTNCEPAVVRYPLEIIDDSGSFRSTINIEILGEEKGKCVFKIRNEDVTIEFSQDSIDTLLAMGMTEEDIEYDRVLAEEQQAKLDETCRVDMDQLTTLVHLVTGLMDRWVTDKFYTDPLEGMECEGAYTSLTSIPQAPAYEEISSEVSGMDETQRAHYYLSLRGLKIEGWTGWVAEVDVSLLGDYTVWVDLDPPTDENDLYPQEVYVPADDDIGLKLNMDQQVIFSGIIEEVHDSLVDGKPIVVLEKVATIEWPGSTSAGEESTATDTQTSTMAPSFEEISENVRGMTEAQWKNYLPSLRGLRIEGWTGWVVSVTDQGRELGLEYALWVDMDSPGTILSNEDVGIPIYSDDPALKLEPGQQVTFSGIIDSVEEWLGGVTVYLQVGATVEW